MKFELTLKHLSLENFRLFDKLEVPFHPKLTVLIGENGAGKTALLEAVAKALNVYVSKLRSKGAIDIDFNKILNENEIKYGQKGTSLKINIGFERIDWEDFGSEKFSVEELNEKMRQAKTDEEHNDYSYRIEHFGESTDFDYGNSLNWTITKTRSDEKADLDLPESNILDQISLDINKKKREQDISIPIVVYYGCNRTNAEMDDDEKQNYVFEPFNTYDFSLNDKSLNFDKFVKFYDWRDRNKDISLIETLKTAILTLMNDDFTDFILNTERFDNPQLIFVDKNNSKVSAAYLSAGQKSLLLLVSDIALRLWLANKYSKESNPLHGQGIVLIDEIDLHLHPKWQAVVVEKLQSIFPNVQWVMTTHSPKVVSSLERENILILNNGQITDYKPFVKGRDTNSIMSDVFHVPKRLTEYEDKLSEIYRFIDNGERENAEESLSNLKQFWGEDDIEIHRAESFLELI